MRFSSTLLAAAGVLAIHSATAGDFAQCLDTFANKTPPRVSGPRASGARAICFDSFAVLHSSIGKTPVYSAEHLTRARLQSAKGEQRTNRFYAEARLPSAERAELADYKAAVLWDSKDPSHFDRGHMSPAGDMPNDSAMAQSFSLANMVPQAPTNNRKTWAGIEKATRQYVMRSNSDIYVITGPVYEGGRPRITLGPDHVGVPEHLFKLVYDQGANRAWAYWVANQNDAKAGPPISYGELVKRTGIEFLPGMHPRS